MASITISLSNEQIAQLMNGHDIVIGLDNGSRQPATSAAKPTGATPDTSFMQFFRQQIARLERNGCQRTAETHRATLRKFADFSGHRDLAFEAVDTGLMEDFQSHLRGQGLSLNTISFYMRILRSVYHKGVEQGIAADCQPFRRVYTGHAKTGKRAISIEEIRRLRDLQIDDAQVGFARDLFLFSFYTRGMSFVDMAYLQRSNIRDGVLSYQRHKKGQRLCIRWEASMQEIVDRCHKAGQQPFLLPIIRKQNGKERNQYRHVQTLVNRNLKEVARMAGIGSNLTMYCARHSWATIARQLQIPMEVISSGMGHANERTTAVYLKAVDSASIDLANRQIISRITAP